MAELSKPWSLEKSRERLAFGTLIVDNSVSFVTSESFPRSVTGQRRSLSGYQTVAGRRRSGDESLSDFEAAAAMRDICGDLVLRNSTFGSQGELEARYTTSFRSRLYGAAKLRSCTTRQFVDMSYEMRSTDRM